MSTVFKRSEHYRKSNSKTPLTQPQLHELGKLVISAYSAVKPPQTPIHFKISEEEGSPKVIDYPRKFTPEIDRIISEYYALKEPRKRKRIPLKNPINYK